MKPFTKKSSLCLALIICVTNINAQVSLLQKAIDKIQQSKNFSFYEMEIIKTSFNPNTMAFNKASTFVRMPNDNNFGYFFKINSKQDCFVYNGQNAVTDLNYQDSSYNFIEPKSYAISLIGYINEVKPKLKGPDSFKQERDTTINAVFCYHFIETGEDSNANGNGDYSYTHWFIGKQSNNILATIYTWRMTDEGNKVIYNYIESSYSDFKFNQDDVDIISLEIPASFHLKKQRTLLKIGTTAPDWTLSSTGGSKLSLSELKGKVVLIDFSYIGCLPCMQAIEPMNTLHEKYKNKKVEIVSIYPIDKIESVTKYVKKYGIKYPVYIDANLLPAKYQITGYPCFYLIDKDGKIAKVFAEYSEYFEAETSSIIENLLNK
jgi:peroxiredoxin